MAGDCLFQRTDNGRRNVGRIEVHGFRRQCCESSVASIRKLLESEEDQCVTLGVGTPAHTGNVHIAIHVTDEQVLHSQGFERTVLPASGTTQSNTGVSHVVWRRRISDEWQLHAVQSTPRRRQTLL